MRRFAFKKLIRDKVIDDMLKSGQEPLYHVMEDNEYLSELKKKLVEEAMELSSASPSDLPEEIADLQEVIDCLIAAAKSTKEDILKIQSQKTARKGSFKRRIYVEDAGGPEGSEFLDYYLKSPHKYPEIKNSN